MLWAWGREHRRSSAGRKFIVLSLDGNSRVKKKIWQKSLAGGESEKI